MALITDYPTHDIINASGDSLFDVIFWVCNSDEEFRQAFELGAEGVMTDYPTRLIRFLEANPQFVPPAWEIRTRLMVNGDYKRVNGPRYFAKQPFSGMVSEEDFSPIKSSSTRGLDFADWRYKGLANGLLTSCRAEAKEQSGIAFRSDSLLSASSFRMRSAQWSANLGSSATT